MVDMSVPMSRCICGESIFMILFHSTRSFGCLLYSKKQQLYFMSSNKSEIRFFIWFSSLHSLLTLWASGRKRKENSAKVEFAQRKFLLYYLSMLLCVGVLEPVWMQSFPCCLFVFLVLRKFLSKIQSRQGWTPLTSVGCKGLFAQLMRDNNIHSSADQ